ncbi:hypothetical protein [Enterocloster hominis (ex Hitch et al. 2024)]|uniref:Uncharacterized protein n=1 Tax=Enterocloster hominis (ex Hitch et al. 2024) TaxID=1917870 RepID=A0ABV1D9N9_9FIRM
MKLKRILALTGALLLVALFVLAIILAVTGAPKNYLMAVIFSMVFIPIIMFAMGLMTRVLKPSEPVDMEALKAEAEKAGMAGTRTAHDKAEDKGVGKTKGCDKTSRP